MPRKSKTAWQKAAGIAKAHASRHPSWIQSDPILMPDAEMNETTPKTSPSPGLEIITDLDNEEISDGIFGRTKGLTIGVETGWMILTCQKQKLINILSQRVRITRNTSGKGRNWRIFTGMMSCQSLREGHTQGQCSKGIWISSTQHYIEVGTLDDLVDGGIQGWEECQRCSISYKEVWIMPIHPTP